MYYQPYLEVIETVLNWNLPEEVVGEAIYQHIMQNTRKLNEDTWQPFEAKALTLSHSL